MCSGLGFGVFGRDLRDVALRLGLRSGYRLRRGLGHGSVASLISDVVCLDMGSSVELNMVGSDVGSGVSSGVVCLAMGSDVVCLDVSSGVELCVDSNVVGSDERSGLGSGVGLDVTFPSAKGGGIFVAVCSSWPGA